MRTPLVLGIVAAAFALILTVAARTIAMTHVTSSLLDSHQIGTATEHLRYQFRALGILSSIVAFAGGWSVGTLLMAPLQRLRAELVAGSIGTIPVEKTAGWNHDAHALKNAALRHESNLLRRTAEQARESADLKQLLNAVSEGLLQLDADSRIMQANPAALRLLGLQRNVRGASLVSLIRHVELRDIITRAARGESVNAAEVTLDERQLLISATPIPDDREAAAPSAVIAIADLTQLRRLEGVRRDFVANVSHELKTPLTSIHGYAETLLADDDVPAATRRPFLEVIHRNAVRLQRIVDDLLDLSRIESGAWHPDLHDVALDEVAADVWSSCADVARTRGIRFHRQVAPLAVRADPHALRQIFSNLFSNAIRYTPESGSITVNAHANGNGMVTISVTDSGIGVPRELLGRIFERFYRVDPARSRSDGGTGLGLAIVKHMAESMNGSVTAESTPGEGTTIILELPAA